MLVDMKASLLKYELSNQTNQLQALQDTLSSKDFEVSPLSSRRISQDECLSSSLVCTTVSWLVYYLQTSLPTLRILSAT